MCETHLGPDLCPESLPRRLRLVSAPPYLLLRGGPQGLLQLEGGIPLRPGDLDGEAVLQAGLHVEVPLAGLEWEENNAIK